MLVDTDVIIWALRGSTAAADAFDRVDRLELSVVSLMELVKGSRNRQDLRLTRSYLTKLGFLIIPLSENIGYRAAIYIEQHGLKSNLGIPDALIAATAMENSLELLTGNMKDYRGIEGLRLKGFRHLQK